MDVMLDFETLGTGHNSVICSAGLVRFNIETGDIIATAHYFADTRSAVDAGRTIDPETVMWWLTQEPAAQQALVKGMDGALTWPRFLHHICGFIEESWRELVPGEDPLRLWSNGATFDITLLENAMAQAHIPATWKYTASRDMRTLVDIAKPFEHSVVREGVQHDALADARYQAAVVSELWRHIKGNQRLLEEIHDERRL
jgi:exodeoxyribonuclease VIII